MCQGLIILLFSIEFQPSTVSAYISIWYRSGDAGKSSGVTLAELVNTHMSQELSSNVVEISILSVRRKHLWEDSLAQFLKRSFDPRKPIRVIFHGEEAVDGGGGGGGHERNISASFVRAFGRNLVFFFSAMSRSSISDLMWPCSMSVAFTLLV